MTRTILVALLLPALFACPRRDRLTGPTGGNGSGPEVTITQPAGDLTTLDAGTSVQVSGFAVDEEGVDSVFLSRPAPSLAEDAVAAGGLPHANFSFVVDLDGAPGDTITITVYAANLERVRGDLVTRRIRLR